MCNAEAVNNADHTYSNEELVKRIQAGADSVNDMLLLWNQTRKFVVMLARKYKGYAEHDDLMQEGYLGLYAAATHYSPDLGATFIHYASFWIRQVMQRFIEQNRSVRMPSDVQQAVRRYERIVAEYRQEYGTEPCEIELQALLRVGADKLRAIKENAVKWKIHSLNEVCGGEESDLTLEDTLAAEQDLEAEALQKYDFGVMQRDLWQAVDDLPKEQSQVIREQYQNDITLRQAGDRLQMEYSAARQAKDKALRHLRVPHEMQKFRPYYETYMTPYPIRHVGVENFQRTGYSEVERAVLGWD